MLGMNSIALSATVFRNTSVLLLLVTFFCCGCDRTKKNATPAAPGISQTGSANANTSGSFETRWLPQDTELLIKIDVQELYHAPLLQIENEQREKVPVLQSAAMDTGLGVELDEIKQITIGVAGISSLDPAAVKQGPQGLDPLKGSSIVVIETIEPVDAARIASLDGVSTTQHADHPYFKRDIGDPEYPPLGIYLPGKTNIVVGPEPVIQKMLTAKESAFSIEPFSFVNPQAHLAVAFVPKDMSKMRNAPLTEGGPTELQKTAQIVQEHADRFGLELTFKDDLDLAVKVHCDDPNQAAILGVELDKVARYAQDQFATNQDSLGMLSSLLSPIVEKLSGTTSGSVAELTTTLPGDTARSFTGMLPMLMMMSGLGGGGNMTFGQEADLTDLIESAVPATQVDGLPANATLKAAVHWNETFVMSGDGEVEPPQQLAVDIIIQGGELQDAVAFGDLQIKSANTAQGVLRQAQSMMSGDPSNRVMVDRNDRWTEVPEDGVVVKTLFHHPVPASDTITDMSGSVEVMVAKQHAKVTIPNLIQTAQSGTVDQALQTAGVEVALLPPLFEGSSQRIAITCPPTVIVTGLQPMKNGEPADSIWPQVEVKPDGSCEYTITGNDPEDLEGIALDLALHTELSPIPIQFTFADLSIPTPKKQPTTEQLQQVTWIPSSVTEGLPDGLRVESQARWTKMTNYGSDGKPKPRTIEVAIDLIGGPALNTIALGQYNLTAMQADTGELKPAKTQFGNDPYQQLVNYGSMMFLNNEPLNGAQALLKFEHPDQAPKVITKVAGELTLVTAKSQQEVLITDIMSKLDGPLEHDALQAAKLTLTPKESGNGFHLAVTGEQPLALEDLVLVDPAGRPLENVYPGQQVFNGVLTYTFLGQEKFPADTQLKIILNEEVETFTIPFEVSNLPLGKEPKAREF